VGFRGVWCTGIKLCVEGKGDSPDKAGWLCYGGQSKSFWGEYQEAVMLKRK